MNRLQIKMLIVLAALVFVSGLTYAAIRRASGSGATPTVGSTPAFEQDKSKLFRQIYFLSDKEGWAISSTGLWHTMNGGRDWNKLRLAPTATSVLGERRANLDQMEFINREVGWLLEDYYLISTSDGGASWQRREIDGVIVKRFHFTSPNEGWAAGEDVSHDPQHHAVLLKTLDGGATWKRLFVDPDEDAHWGFVDICPLTEDNIWAIGDITLHSSDGGKTWKRVDLPDGIYGVPVEVRFADVNLGWILTNQGEKFLVTTDGGASWSVRAAPSGTGGFTDLVYVSASEAWGLSSGLYHTTDGGDSWTRIGQDKVYAIQYLREQRRLLTVGAAGLIYDNSKQLRQ